MIGTFASRRAARRPRPRISLLRFVLLGLFGLVGPFAAVLPLAAQQSDFLETQQRIYAERLAPLLADYCRDCHADGTSEGGLDLDRYPDYLSALEDRDRWLKLKRRIENGDMPPADGPSISDAHRREMVSLLDGLLEQLDCASLARPGHVTIRRLNRVEYRNTVRDLTGIDYLPAADFPGDDVGYGFDHIGDVLSLPPILLEKYLEAAETIAEAAIIVAPDAKLELRVAGAALSGVQPTGERRSEAGALTTEGAALTEVEIPARGRYEIRIRAYGDQAGDEPARMAFRIDDDSPKTVDVKATSRSPSNYVIRVDLEPGKRRIGGAFVNDFYRPDHPIPSRRDRNLILESLEIRGPLDAPSEADLPATHRRLVFVTPASESATDRRSAAEQVVQRMASRAFRRPATADEIERLTTLAISAIDDGETFESGIQLALQAILVSPHFLYKVERPLADGEDRRDLDPFEFATSLSYFLWSSMPDDELLRAAWEGRLSDPQERRRQVLRMLADPRSAALVDNFAEQWLQLRVLDRLNPDPERFPEFDQELRAAMREETRLLFAEVLRSDLSVMTLLEADFTFVNGRLARHYGIANVDGDEFRRVSTAGTGRGGLLTQASILTLTSNPTRTSPVKRGKWVLENLLGEPPPPPAPGVMELEAQEQLTGTLRERMQQHRENPACAACHAPMDPIGFALENFDAIGRYRTDDDGLPIDAAGVLPDGSSFAGAIELQRLLSTSRRERFVATVAEKLTVYALGRGLRFYDACAVDRIVFRAEAGDLKFSELVVAIVESDPFRARSRPWSRP